MAFLVMDPGLTAALAVGMASYAGYIFKLPPVGIKALAIATIMLLGAINVRRIRLSARLIRWLTIHKLGTDRRGKTTGGSASPMDPSQPYAHVRSSKDL
jgi:hypothetical protein